MCDHSAAVFPLTFEFGEKIQQISCRGRGLSGIEFYMFHENRQLGRAPVNAWPRGRAVLMVCQLLNGVGGVSVQELSPENSLFRGQPKSFTVLFFF